MSFWTGQDLYMLQIAHMVPDVTGRIEYYDMKLATFGMDADSHMIIAFPVFVKDHTSKPKTLYEIETRYPYLTITKLQTAIQKLNIVKHT